MKSKNISDKSKDKNNIKEDEKPKDEEEYDIDITSNSNYEEVSLFLREKLHISQNIIEDLPLDGKILFELESDDIDNLIDKQYNKEIKSLKKFIEKRKKISKNQLDKNKVENIDNKILINENKEKEGFINEKGNINIENENKNTKNKNEYNIQPLNDKSKYNVFIHIALKKNIYNNIKISFSSWACKKMFNSLKYRILDVRNKYINKQNLIELFLIQIELCGFIERLDITIINDKKKSNGTLDIKDINNYFSLDNFSFDKSSSIDKIIYNISKNNMFTNFFEYFFVKKSECKEEFKKDLMLS